ncbi:MAG: hypothetical protein P8Y34_03925 [Anaerolineales bacterium]
MNDLQAAPGAVIIGADLYFPPDILVVMSSGKSRSEITPTGHLDLFGV